MCDAWDEANRKKIPVSNLVSPQVIVFLKAYYKQKLSVNDIATALNISYRTLSRKFKDETGITISEKLEQIRINEARRLLLETNKTMLQIAEEVGYENEFYFSRVFKKHEYLSPTSYRRYRKDLKK